MINHVNLITSLPSINYDFIDLNDV